MKTVMKLSIAILRKQLDVVATRHRELTLLVCEGRHS